MGHGRQNHAFYIAHWLAHDKVQEAEKLSSLAARLESISQWSWQTWLDRSLDLQRFWRAYKFEEFWEPTDLRHWLESKQLSKNNITEKRWKKWLVIEMRNWDSLRAFVPANLGRPLESKYLRHSGPLDGFVPLDRFTFFPCIFRKLLELVNNMVFFSVSLSKAFIWKQHL